MVATNTLKFTKRLLFADNVAAPGGIWHEHLTSCQPQCHRGYTSNTHRWHHGYTSSTQLQHTDKQHSFIHLMLHHSECRAVCQAVL